MRHIVFVFFFLSLFTWDVVAGEKVTLVVRAGRYDRTDCVVAADLSGRLKEVSSSLRLYEVIGKKKQFLPCQLQKKTDGSVVLYFILSGDMPAGSSRTFIAEVVKKKARQKEFMEVEDTQSALILKREGKGILQYNYTFTSPPKGVDKVFGRSGFIHPAYSPAGHVLTNIQPRDHYHHYGIWNPWTRVEYDKKVYDLWNLGDKQGTVRATGIHATVEGNVFSGYSAGLDHVIFSASGEKVIMGEEMVVRAWNTPEAFMWDFDSFLSPSTALPVVIKAYRYAGFSWRGTEEWTKENCEMMTSEGKSRQQIDGSIARWIYTTGQCGTDRAGIMFLAHPDNYNSPEPLRIWDENANGGRGDAFMNFSPTKNKDWELKPDKTYALRYRVLTYDGEMTPERADRLWNSFAYPPEVEIK
ncbi:hypothetical protein D0T51_09885 [Parabacteroides sp. 52]|uniref:DUF6807 domain-containing protein n=1 Tax=unclassified Parabacteroides TaxID=2649774 RepID=UPI0013D6B08D|nr:MULTISPECIES: PmoA family protein [unclassified Parabacteroides]MDH6535557.1 hypothetical protein [Parabacteroides sp. PM5-20]NDV56036.1 hypothetical protein [Parabacteroides sp. 52]